MSGIKGGNFYKMTMHELDSEERFLEARLTALREARRELINRTGANKPQSSGQSRPEHYDWLSGSEPN